MEVIDEVEYSDEPPWPVKPDGLNRSLERIAPGQPDATARNWAASTVVGGTPGAQNSVYSTSLPPWIQNVQHTLDVPVSTPIVVTAEILGAPTTAQLTYKIDFEATDTTIELYDDGAHGDDGNGDGVYGNSIPGLDRRPARATRHLSEVDQGEVVTVNNIMEEAEDDKELMRFLERSHLTPGASLVVEEIERSNQTITVAVDSGPKVTVGPAAAQVVKVFNSGT